MPAHGLAIRDKRAMLGCKLLSLSLLLTLATACGSSDTGPSEACKSACQVGCDAARECGLDMDDDQCAEDCLASLGAVDCSETTPLDRLTCDELEHVFDCNAHCSALCRRSLDCATFNEQTCLTGCAIEHGSICNAASVPVRSCDDIKREARFYEEVGQAKQSGGHAIFVGGGGPSFGLCSGADDCDEPLACDFATNTCGKCDSDTECAREAGVALACQKGACVTVECVVDDDCSGSLCDTEKHVCGRCESDGDCSDYAAEACDTETSTCVECTDNADCADAFSVTGTTHVCEPTSHACVECLQNSDCHSTYAPRCNLDTHRCAKCQSDKDCADGELCDTSVGKCN